MSMRKSLILAVLMTGLLFAQTASHKSTGKTAAKAKPAATITTPDNLQWTDAPPVLPAGGKMTVLSGNPNGGGAFVVRLKMPDGYRVMPHWHPTTENVTVLSGEFRVAMGDKFDESKLQSLPAGSFASVPMHHNHYGMSKGETVVQINGMGPFKLVYVNPGDDPSKAKK